VTADLLAGPVTTEQFLRLPEQEGIDRELILGAIWERPATLREPRNAHALANLAALLGRWCDAHPDPKRTVHCGGVSLRLTTSPDSLLEIDLAVVPADLPIVEPSRRTAFLDGVPLLAAQILAPDDEHERIADKLRAYCRAGVPLVWVVDPDFRYVIAHRPDAEPELFNVRQELTAEPVLPGFRAPVARVFGL
jgi:Uma2 family endonuclease